MDQGSGKVFSISGDMENEKDPRPGGEELCETLLFARKTEDLQQKNNGNEQLDSESSFKWQFWLSGLLSLTTEDIAQLRQRRYKSAVGALIERPVR